MQTSSFLPPVEKLKGVDDYNDWKFAMMTYLQHENLWEYVTEAATATDPAKNSKGKSKIILGVDRINYSHVRQATTAKEAWTNLEKAFEDSGLTRRVGLLRTLTSTKLNDCANVEEYINKIFDAAQKLDNLKFKVDDEWIGSLLLTGLPDVYQPMIMALESSGTKITGQVIKAKLLQDVRPSETSTNSEAAFFIKHKKQNYNNSNNLNSSYRSNHNTRRGTHSRQNFDKSKVKCYNCNRYGHFSKECNRDNFKKGNEQSHMCTTSSEAENDTDLAWTVSNNNTQFDKNNWYLDSGATDHMTPNKDLFDNFSKIDKVISLADNSQLKSEGHGEISIKIKVNHEIKNIRLNKVLYVPKLAANLISIKRLAEKGLKMIFTGNKCIIKSKINTTIATATLDNNMYKLDTPEPSQSNARIAKDIQPKIEIQNTKSTGITAEPDLWH